MSPPCKDERREEWAIAMDGFEDNQNQGLLCQSSGHCMLLLEEIALRCDRGEPLT
ncbi:hypothetical protein NEA10_01775 [Phormidium yuhuli AB48]|uniref:Uncharacterized protein n=1 Tax=Phormidium yuhuli AB48 TaxID=2940671 RepID=A0ABY5AWV9_9CYAN|nr:hypothetical protein [Phormidium yuhuli]USR93246.1 hypothetical protein NEA10_01775 [Phormidium yuhuli AB48]